MKINFYIITFLIIIGSSCNDDTTSRPDSEIPVLSPKSSMKKMILEDADLTIKLVASEPLISTPVAMNIDDKGRIWVVEMADYKPIKEDSTQRYPMGKVTILSDDNRDGKMDKRKVFLDSIAFPRALCLMDDGILVAEPPNLWYYEIVNDKPGQRTLVDPAYTVSDNIEGQTNGLLRGIDNWVYSAGFGSGKRYRRMNSEWITERTFLRGQWGITQDDYGRLFYNNNSQNLLGDYFLPGVTSGNKYLRRTSGFNEKIVSDNRTYPLIPTPGVNRGYKEDILDSTGRLINLTAACGPLIYRGGLLSPDYAGNGFVAEPAAYLIKRNILRNNGIEVQGKQAWVGKEFLVSSDERFRPVSLYDGPDGALYVVDMYRGVIQDDLSLTDYLKEFSLEHDLQSPINTGRIYKIVPKDKKAETITIPDDPDKLVSLLESPNGWVRDHAQQKIVNRQYKEAASGLRMLLFSDRDEISRIHALWTLEGLGALTKEDILKLFNSRNATLQQQTLTAFISIVNENNYADYLTFISDAVAGADSLIAPYLTFAVGKLYRLKAAETTTLWDKLIRTFPENPYVIDAVISSIQGTEEVFRGQYAVSTLFHDRLSAALKDKDHPESKQKMEVLKKKYETGYAIFQGFCQTCHGADGNGFPYLAPPLNGSEWVTGDKDILMSIVLYGLTGPVRVKGTVYRKPTITGDMPGINEKYPDNEIAELLSFIRQAWNNDANAVTEKDIKQIKERLKGRSGSFTAEELGQKTE